MIGIATFYKELNYGAVLQAYALKAYLEKEMDEEIRFINYNTIKQKFSFKENVIRLMMLPILLKKKYIFWKYRKEELPETQPTNANIDILFLGSDQIWNPKLTGEKILFPFCGIDRLSIRNVAYGASIGRLDNLEIYKKEYNKLSNNIESISFREKRVAREFGFKYAEAEFVCDPSLLIGQAAWKKFSEKSKVCKKINEKYIFVYLLEENEKITEKVNELAREKKLRVISLRANEHYENNDLRFPYASPYDFVQLIENAELVITNSYHGLMFSTIFEKRICLFKHSRYNDRIEDFLENFLVCQNNKKYEEVVDLKIDIDRNGLNDHIDNSQKYILQNLKIKNEE